MFKWKNTSKFKPEAYLEARALNSANKPDANCLEYARHS